MGALILAGSGGKMLRGMENVLDAVQHDRPRCPNVEQAFDAQYCFTVRVQQHTQPDAKGNPIEWLRKGQGKRVDLCTMRVVRSWGVRSPLVLLLRQGASGKCR